MNRYPTTWLPPHIPISRGMNAEHIAAPTQHPDLAQRAIKHLQKYLDPMADVPKKPNLTDAVKVWIAILSDPTELRHGVLVWFIANSKRASGNDKWIHVLGYAQGRQAIPMKGPTS